ARDKIDALIGGWVRRSKPLGEGLELRPCFINLSTAAQMACYVEPAIVAGGVALCLAGKHGFPTLFGDPDVGSCSSQSGELLRCDTDHRELLIIEERGFA